MRRGSVAEGVSCGEGADLYEVVGEDAVSAPGSGSVDAGEYIPVAPLINRNKVSNAATGPIPALASTGTKKLQIPRINRAVPKVMPCAVPRSSVGNSSWLNTL